MVIAGGNIDTQFWSALYRLLIVLVCSVLSPALSNAEISSAAKKPPKIKPSNVFTVVDELGNTRYCVLVKGKAQYVIKKGKKNYTLGSEKLKELKASVKAARGKQLKKLKKSLAKFKIELNSGTISCRATNSEALAPLSRPLTRADVALLLERGGFGLSAEDEGLVNVGLNQGIEALVNQFMATQSETPGLLDHVADILDESIGNTTTQSPGGQRKAILDLWINTKNPYAEKMSMFLLGVWTVAGEVIADETFRSAFWDYYERLRSSAYGDTNLPDLGAAITRDPLMLIYLNNELNISYSPNENYARELMELFTLGPNSIDGVPNYTETGDIPTAAKMLTGWTVKLNYQTKKLDASFKQELHTPGSKTMFKGTSFEFSGDNDEDLVRGIFAHHPGVKHYYAREILKEYLTPDPPAELVRAFGEVIAANGYNLRPAMKVLFMSQAFYDPAYRHTVPMAPYDMIARVVRVMQLQKAVNLNNLHYDLRRTEFYPNLSPSVFWYPQDSWNSSTVILEKANTIASMFADKNGQAAAGWSPQTMLPVGAVTNDQLIEFVRNKLSLPELNAGQKQALISFLSTTRQYDGKYVPFTYDNTNLAHQRSKGLGLYFLLMLSPGFQIH